jgi:hypothetical protein
MQRGIADHHRPTRDCEGDKVLATDYEELLGGES